VERIWLAMFQRSLAETVTQQLRQHALAGVQAALETALVEALEVYRTAWRTQQPPFTCLPVTLQRSGSYTRQLLTTYSNPTQIVESGGLKPLALSLRSLPSQAG
jgi:hypothetical protein